MKILITFALEREFAPWGRLGEFTRARSGKSFLFERRVNGAEVRVLLTGVGAESAHRAIRDALADPPEVCISTGLAGGLQPEHRPGRVVAARAVRQLEGSAPLTSDPDLFDAAVSLGAKPAGMFLTAPRLVTASRAKHRLAALAEVVEMESYPVLAEASACGARCVALRAICDPVEMDLPYDFDRAMDARGRVRVSNLIAQVMVRPAGLPGLLALGRESRNAAIALASFLEGYVTAIAERVDRPEKAEELATA